MSIANVLPQILISLSHREAAKMVVNPLYLQIAITILIAAIGVVITHRFTSQRDRKNAERLRRLEGLSKAYFAFVRSGIQKDIVKRDHEGKLLPTARELEEAIATIHLYGTNKQSVMANDCSTELAETQKVNFTKLIDSLRETIRSDLGLEQLLHKPGYLSIEIFPEKIFSGTRSATNPANQPIIENYTR